MGSLKLITAPAVEPLTLADTKLHLRETGQLNDTYINTLIKMARRAIETFTGRQFITATWEWNLNNFSSVLEVPLPNLIAVNSIKYLDVDGVQQTWNASLYTVDIDSEPGLIYPAFGEDYPDLQVVRKAVTINFDAGYGVADTDIPEDLKQSMLELIAHKFEVREPIIVGAPVAPVPMTAHWLAWPFRRFVEI